METAANIISAAVKLAPRADSIESLADKIAEATAPLDRAGYLSIISAWKEAYKQTAAEVRRYKVERKGDVGGLAQSHRQYARFQGRNLMAYRMALKELARRHRAATASAAA
jgi:hypothetical protein